MIEEIQDQIDKIQDLIKDPHLCEGTALVYSRISGYFRPTEFWNAGKQEEFQQRVEYSLE